MDNHYENGSGFFVFFMIATVVMVALCLIPTIIIKPESDYFVYLSILTGILLGVVITSIVKHYSSVKPSSRKSYAISLQGSFKNYLKVILKEYEKEGFIRANKKSIFSGEMYKLLTYAILAKIPTLTVENDIRAIVTEVSATMDFNHSVAIIVFSNSWILYVDSRIVI